MEKLYRADGIPAILSAAQIPEAGFSAGPEDIEWSRYSNFALLHTSGGRIILRDKLEEYAWDFIYNTAAGPLTNVAAFLISYPDLADRIEQIALMGGAVFEKMLEALCRYLPGYSTGCAWMPSSSLLSNKQIAKRSTGIDRFRWTFCLCILGCS